MIDILYIGPFKTKNTIVGGYAEANERIVAALKRRSVSTSKAPYYSASGGVIQKSIGYAFYSLNILIKLVSFKFKRTEDKKIVHLTGLYKQFIYFEWFIIKLSGVLGIYTVYDVRAGSATRHFDKRTSLYRRTFESVLKSSNDVFVEGREIEDWIKSILGYLPFYLPNFVKQDTFFELNLDKYYNSPLKLLYFGRINKDKGLDTMLEVNKILNLTSIKSELHLVGSLGSAEKETIKSYENVTYYGIQNQKEIKKLANTSHFFIFPTRHKGEGHSNSLTEAMAWGLIPVVTNNGFLKTVVADTGIVLDKSATPEEFVIKIKELLGEDLSRLASKCIEQIQLNYSEDTVITNLINQYHK
ncbi:MAG: glycosyltransferase involved in cell wall biosynthesis [Colwellia sp.]|jgi:glycosyltransferase involved in cell wall biosynthesis